MLAIPVAAVACFLSNFAPSHMASSSLVSVVNKISRSAGLWASGNKTNTVFSWSTPVNHKISLACLNGNVPSALVG